MLRECLAMGADEAYLLSDRAFGGADTCATSTTIAAGISKVEGVDVIFAGRQAIDGRYRPGRTSGGPRDWDFLWLHMCRILIWATAR